MLDCIVVLYSAGVGYSLCCPAWSCWTTKTERGTRYVSTTGVYIIHVDSFFPPPNFSPSFFPPKIQTRREGGTIFETNSCKI